MGGGIGKRLRRVSFFGERLGLESSKEVKVKEQIQKALREPVSKREMGGCVCVCVGVCFDWIHGMGKRHLKLLRPSQLATGEEKSKTLGW